MFRVLPKILNKAPLLSPRFHLQSMTGLLMYYLHLKRLSLIGWNFVRALFIGRRVGCGMENQALSYWFMFWVFFVNNFTAFVNKQQWCYSILVFCYLSVLWTFSGQQYLMSACHLNMFQWESSMLTFKIQRLIDYELVDIIILRNHERISKKMQNQF